MTDKSHEQLKATKMKQDEETFVLIGEHIINNQTDPFDIATHPATLVNIATGMHATAEVQCSLLEAVTSGKKKVKLFLKCITDSRWWKFCVQSHKKAYVKHLLS